MTISSSCRVRIQSIDVQGAKELGAALSGLGVRVVQRSPDLTITLVSDYLDARLAELNRQHLADRTPWLLVQPSGIFPLVGPVFSPGESACWTCLSDRMRRNREIKGMLDRSQRALRRGFAAHPTARSDKTESSLQPSKSRRPSPRGFRHGLERSHHQPRSAGCEHREALRGGRARNVRAAAARSCATRAARRSPIELGAGGKLVMTSGGYRTVSPRDTVARFRKHVSPLTGVVSALERIEADMPMNTNYYAAHNFSAPATNRR